MTKHRTLHADGSITNRLITHFKANPEPITKARVVELLGCKPNTLPQVLKKAIAAGYIARTGSTSNVRYAPGHNIAKAQAAAPPAEPTLREELAAQRVPSLRLRRDPRLTPLDPKPLNITRWPDDDIGITGFNITDDGQTVMLTRDMVAQFVAFVCQPHTPADRFPL